MSKVVIQKSAPATPRTAADLKQRFEQARRKQAALQRLRDSDVSGVRPIARADATFPTEQVVSIPAAASPPMAGPAWKPFVRGLGFVVLGVVCGVAVARWGWPADPPSPLVVMNAASDVVRQGDVDPARAAFTEIVTEPVGAEVVLRGAVVANTPARVPRPAYEALYLLRHSGYHPQLVRVSPQTGEAVVVRLRPLAEEQPELATVGPKPRANRQPDPVGRSRGNDVGRQSAPKRSDGLAVGSRLR